MALYESKLIGNEGAGIDVERDGDLLWSDNGSHPSTMADGHLIIYRSSALQSYIKSNSNKLRASIYPYFAIVTIDRVSGDENINKSRRLHIVDAYTFFGHGNRTCPVASIVNTSGSTYDFYVRKFYDNYGLSKVETHSMATVSLTDDDFVPLTAQNLYDNFCPADYDGLGPHMICETSTFPYLQTADIFLVGGKSYYLYDVDNQTCSPLTPQNLYASLEPNGFLLGSGNNTIHVAIKNGTNDYTADDSFNFHHTNESNLYIMKKDKYIAKCQPLYSGEVSVSAALKVNSSGNSQSYIIPTDIYGLKGTPFEDDWQS